MGYILAIDQGMSGSRAIIYDRKANQRASAYNEFTQYFPKPGWVEHDAHKRGLKVYAYTLNEPEDI